MTKFCKSEPPKRTEAEELAHSLRNIAAAMEGSLGVMQEATGDEQLQKTVRVAMGRQVEYLKVVVERADRIARRGG